MESTLHTFPCADGEYIRYQTVRPDRFASLRFFSPASCREALDCVSDIYRNHLVPVCPWLFGALVLFCLPENFDSASVPVAVGNDVFSDPLLSVAALFRKSLSFRENTPLFSDSCAESLYREIDAAGCIRIVRGKLPFVRVLPLAHSMGFLTGSLPDAALKCNASFFIMDPFDCDSGYDTVGTPFGLAVENGTVLRPPLFHREALLVSPEEEVSVEVPELTALTVIIGNGEYRHGENARFFQRPDTLYTPAFSGTDAIIVGNRVAALHRGGHTRVPASGFVMRCENATLSPGDQVRYKGLEQVLFGIQTGNSIVRNGVPTDRFLSPFWNVRTPWRVPFPPSLYPLDFKTGRAARMVLGAGPDGKPVLLFAEGAGKFGHRPGEESAGASLSELGEICIREGLTQAVNLDGGGSAQLLLGGVRSLRLSGRNPDSLTDEERPVPSALLIP